MAATQQRMRNRVAAVVFVLLLFGVTRNSPAGASTWTVLATANASGLARSLDPQPPATATASCTAPQTDRSIDVSWSAVSEASAYVVYRSATSSTGGFAAVASGITGTTWTDTSLKKGTYWYAVAAVVGSSAWTSPMSQPTAGHAIGTLPRCI